MTTTGNSVIATGKISIIDIIFDLDISRAQKRGKEFLESIFGSASIEIEIDVATKRINIFVEDTNGNIAGMCVIEDVVGVSTMFIGVGVRGEERHQIPTSFPKGATHGIDTSHTLSHSYYREMTSGEGDVDPWGVMNTPQIKVEDEYERVIYEAITLSQLLSEHLADFPKDLFTEAFGEWMVYITASSISPWMYELRFENQHGQVAGFSGYTYARNTKHDIDFLQVACGMKIRKGEQESICLPGASENTTQMLGKMKFTEERLDTPYDSSFITIHATQQP